MGRTRIQMSIKKHLRITHIDAPLMGAVNHQKYYIHLLLIACVYAARQYPLVNVRARIKNSVNIKCELFHLYAHDFIEAMYDD